MGVDLSKDPGWTGSDIFLPFLIGRRLLINGHREGELFPGRLPRPVGSITGGWVAVGNQIEG